MAASVFTNGVSDHVYPGHVLTLAESCVNGDVLVLFASNNGASATTVSSMTGNTGTWVEQDHFVNASGSVLTCLTCGITGSGVPTITTSNDSDIGFTVLGVRGLSSATAHKAGHNGNNTNNPLTVSLTPTVNCFLATGYCNESVDDFSSFTESQSLYQHDTSHVDASGYNLLKSAGSTYTPGANVTGAATNSILAIMLPIASGGTAGLRRSSSLNGLGSSGPFFGDPLAMRNGLYVPQRLAA